MLGRAWRREPVGGTESGPDKAGRIGSVSKTMKKNTQNRQLKKLSAEKKYQIFLEAQRQDKTAAEILRREGLYSTDLARIRQHVKEGALERLKAKPGRKTQTVSLQDYQELKSDLEKKERVMAEMSVELMVLKKKVNGGSWER